MTRLIRFLLLFLLLQLTDLALGTIIESVLLPEQLLLEAWSKEYTQTEIANLLYHRENHLWIVRLLKGIMKLLSIAFITGTLSTGLLVNDYKIKWLPILGVVTLAEFIFLIPLLLKLFWFSCVQTDYTYANFSDFSALSLYNLLDYAEDWQKSPLKQINVFELLFWVALATGLQKVYNISLSNGMTIVMQSYGVFFFLWMTLTVFLSLM